MRSTSSTSTLGTATAGALSLDCDADNIKQQMRLRVQCCARILGNTTLFTIIIYVCRSTDYNKHANINYIFYKTDMELPFFSVYNIAITRSSEAKKLGIWFSINPSLNSI